MSGPSQKNLLALFLTGCLEVALHKSSLAKRSRREMLGISAIVFWHLSLQPRRGKQTGRSFHVPVLDFRAQWGMFVHGVGMKPCCSDSLFRRFPVVPQSCLGLRAATAKQTWGVVIKVVVTPFLFCCF